MFGQSALAGLIAGECTGFVCDSLETSKKTKRIAQAISCAVAGGATAFFTVDPIGAALTAGEVTIYAIGNNPSPVLTPALTLLAALSGQPQPHFSHS